MSVYYQICFIDRILVETGEPTYTKRLNLKVFRSWVKELISEGHSVKIEYDPVHYTYFAMVRGDEN